MEGRLGAIYIDERQVGGFTDWSVKLNLSEGAKDKEKVVALQSWIVRAKAHYLFRELEPGKIVQLKLCADAGPGYWIGSGAIANETATTLGVLIHRPFEVVGHGELEAKKVE